jgi:hypothetical protein
MTPEVHDNRDADLDVHDGNPREFRFFPSFPITAFFFIVIAIGLIVILWIPLVYLYFYSGMINGVIARTASSSTLTFLLIAALGRLSSRELAKVRFIVSREGIIRKTPFRTTGIRWTEVDRLSCRSMPFVKGFVALHGRKRSLLLPSTIVGFASLGEAISRELHRAGKASLYDETLVTRMAAFGRVAEAWNERARAYLVRFTVATIGAAALNALTAGKLWAFSPVPLILWASIGIPLPLVAYAVADARFNRRYEKALIGGFDFDKRQAFRNELLMSALVASLAYAVLGILIKPIFLP